MVSFGLCVAGVCFVVGVAAVVVLLVGCLVLSLRWWAGAVELVNWGVVFLFLSAALCGGIALYGF